MLLDKAQIKIQSGKGGNGIVTFRKEKFVAHGGPDGGDGGDGGSVYIEATEDMSTLLDFQYQSVYKAQDGEKGGKKNCHGKNGENLIIKVPCGTIVRDIKNDLSIADLKRPGERVLVAKGGRGGKGNAKFKSNRNKAPHFCEPGESGIERELELELKLIADLGIIGFPNAGKSTLISKLSAAKPKIANYAFTTLRPNLGVIYNNSNGAYRTGSASLADIPGLIEGASEGVGLGHDFLRHIERTRLLIHIIDVWGFSGDNVLNESEFRLDEALGKNQLVVQKSHQDPLQNFYVIKHELEKYSPKLAEKKQILVLNKIEAYPEEELKELEKQFKELFSQEKNLLSLKLISAVDEIGLEELKLEIFKALDELVEEEDSISLDHDFIADDLDDSAFSIEVREKRDPETKTKYTYWQVHCGKLERLMKVTDIREIESLTHLFRVSKSMGLFEELKRLGAVPGDSMDIDGLEFELDEANLH
jgi:GTPase